MKAFSKLVEISDFIQKRRLELEESEDDGAYLFGYIKYLDDIERILENESKKNN